MNSINLWNRMNILSMTSENSETIYPHRLLLNLSDRINVKRSDTYVACCFIQP